MEVLVASILKGAKRIESISQLARIDGWLDGLLDCLLDALLDCLLMAC
jgi:hypothetical protein